MWQYVSHEFQELRPSGTIFIRVYIQNEGVPECFTLEYNSMPDDATVVAHATNTINLKNQQLTQQ